MKLFEKKTIMGIVTAVLIAVVALFTALDKGFDFWDEHIAVDPDKPKVVIEKPENTMPEYVLYKDRTLHEFKADNINKQEN